MAKQEYVDIIKQGVGVWNTWRELHPELKHDPGIVDFNKIDLSDSDLSNINLSGVNFSDANLSGTDLGQTNLSNADLSGAFMYRTCFVMSCLRNANLSGVLLGGALFSDSDLTKANLWEAELYNSDFSGANLSKANLRGTHLGGANFTKANLTDANLTGANLSEAVLVGTNLTNAILKDCIIYGLSAWDVKLDGAEQINLTITPEDQSTISVDNLEVAQFIYLLLNNPKIRDVIDTVAQKAVLILGRFTPTRKPILEAIRTALRSKGYVPILFDFEKPSSKDLTETVSTLAHLSRFIIADLTDPGSVPHELGTIIPNHVVPIVPLFHPTDSTRHEYAMFQDLRKRHRDWVLPIHHYTTLEDLLTTLQTQIIEPAEKRAQELIIFKNTKETGFL